MKLRKNTKYLGIVAVAILALYGAFNLLTQALEQEYEKEIDLGIGREMLNSLPIYNRIFELDQSNRISESLQENRSFMLWQLEGVWKINKHYNGALNEKLQRLLREVYPGLKKDLDMKQLQKGMLPSMLVDMTNFMSDAETIIKENPPK